MPDRWIASEAFLLERRRVLQIFGILAAGAIIPEAVAGANDSIEFALQPLSDASIRNPELTGELPLSGIDRLWRIFEHIGGHWSNAADVAMDRQRFARILALKVSEFPSYLTEYSDASDLFSRLEAQLGDSAQALRVLFTPPSSTAPDFPSTPLGHAQTYVVTEFINLQIANGGFRHFGYVNYPGWIGGPLADVAELPYREWK
jgi:hypothetical protein